MTGIYHGVTFCAPILSSAHNGHTHGSSNCVHSWGYKVHYLACTAQSRVRTAMGQVFTFAGSGVVK